MTTERIQATHRACTHREAQRPARTLWPALAGAGLALALGLPLAGPLHAFQTRAPVWNNPPPQPIPGVEHHTFYSDAMETEVGYSILLPSGYRSSKRRYAVTYWLHGLGDNESSAPRPVARSMIEARFGQAPK